MDNTTFKARILNYQRLKSVTLEFIPGLNVIVGESNNGKTAVLRALETAIYNIPREEHITLGETKSAVGIQYNGHEIIWRRDKEKASQVSYRVDGKIYQKLGRGQPQEVAEALGISELDINDKKFRLNFSKQMSYPFLLDSTPSDMFKFIAQSSGEDNLIEVLKQMKKDVNEISAKVKSHEETQKVLGESLVQLEKRYNEIKDKRQYCEEVLSLDSKVKILQDLQDNIEVYKKCDNAVNKMSNSLNYYKGVFNDLSSSVSVADSYMKKMNEIRLLTDTWYQKLEEVTRLSLDKSKYEQIISKYSDLDSYYESYRSQDANREKASNIRQDITRYKNINEDLTSIINQASVLDGKVERYNKFIEALDKVITIKEDRELTLSILKTDLSERSGYELEIKSYQVELLQLGEELNNIVSNINNIGVCPYCGSVLTGGNHGH